MSRSCKICWIILAVFFVGNLVVFSFWYKNMNKTSRLQSDRNANSEQLKQQFRQKFMENVDMDTLQYEEFARMRNEHMNEVNQYQKRLDSLKMILMSQTFSGETNLDIVEKSIDEIAETQKKIELLNFYHYKTIRSKCRNDEQRLKLDQTFKSWMDKPRGRHRRGRGPR